MKRLFICGLVLLLCAVAPARLGAAGPSVAAGGGGVQQLNEAFENGIQANHSAAEAEALKPRIAELLSLFTDAKQGDVILLDFLPESGTAVSVNGHAKGKPISGEDFYRALLRIWLGDKPVDGDLKKSLLGQAL